jgi:hypothetical protein
MSTNKLRQEREIIGRLLVEYGEMELDLCNCVAMGIDDLDMALKAMFRARGETLRIDIAETKGLCFFGVPGRRPARAEIMWANPRRRPVLGAHGADEADMRMWPWVGGNRRIRKQRR